MNNNLNKIKSIFYKKCLFINKIFLLIILINNLFKKDFKINYYYLISNNFIQFLFLILIIFPIFFFLNRRYYLIYYLVCNFLLLITIDFLKRFYYIPRPDKLERILIYLLNNKCALISNNEFKFFLIKFISKTHNSFPSAHAASSCFAFFSCFNYLNKFILFIGNIFVLLICFERIFSNKHRFSDVFSGGFIGYLFSKLFKLFINKNLFT